MFAVYTIVMSCCLSYSHLSGLVLSGCNKQNISLTTVKIFWVQLTCRNVAEELPIISVPFDAVKGVEESGLIIVEGVPKITSQGDFMTNLCSDHISSMLIYDKHSGTYCKIVLGSPFTLLHKYLRWRAE